MIPIFYDIESFENVFTNSVFNAKDNHIDVFILANDTDSPFHVSDFNTREFVLKLPCKVREDNASFTGTISFHDLSTEEANIKMAKMFGVSDARYANDINNPSHYPKELRLLCDTDKEYDIEKHPFLMGYNSANYDTTMLAVYFHEVWNIRKDDKDENKTTCVFIPTKPSNIRRHNDELFTAKFINNMPTYLTMTQNLKTGEYSSPNYNDPRYLIRKNMLMSGRHIDVSRLNEKQQKVALKRLCGMLGLKILESNLLVQNKKTIDNKAEFWDLVSYNVSDVVKLEKLFNHKAYKSAFDLKRGLMNTYPELVYNRQSTKYAPNIAPEQTRRDRMTIDSSSAQFATKSLCPYNHLTDFEFVSFDYPHPTIAKKLNLTTTNVLEDCKDFFYKQFSKNTTAHIEARAAFDKVYKFYKTIEGKNFNDSEFYQQDFATQIAKNPTAHAKADIEKLSKVDSVIPYFDKNGNPTSCFINFSKGGIHGAEYNKALYDHDLQKYKELSILFKYAKSVYPNPCDLKAAKNITINGVTYPWKTFLKSNSTLKKAEYKDIDASEPKLFVESKAGNWKLNDTKYAFTSAAAVNHEDFVSYYPNLLRMMNAFFNEGLGYDRYGEIFDKKTEYGKLRKDPNLSKDEQQRYNILREGVKLILNSASGAGDASYESPVRINNKIISMRIIGQLFSWRIGQAQTFEGANIVSTNTDGLYSVLEEKKNNKILDRESKTINIEIEPEPMYLISKDTNNRLELIKEPNGYKVNSAAGGTLACYEGPNPTKSLAHPAILDYALVEYLKIAGTPDKIYQNKQYDIDLTNELDRNLGKEILMNYINNPNITQEQKLLMFQNIIASSNGSVTYIFGIDPKTKQHKILQHYNRVFIMKNNTPNTMHLKAACMRVITDATIKKRKKDGNVRLVQHDPQATQILTELNVFDQYKDSGVRESAIKKVPKIEDDWHMLIENEDLFFLPANRKQEILDNLDIDKYVGLLADSFNNNWRNIAVTTTVETTEGDSTNGEG